MAPRLRATERGCCALASLAGAIKKYVRFQTIPDIYVSLAPKASVAIDESPGGISPPGAPKTVREPLDSHGSRCSTVGRRAAGFASVHGLLLLPDGFSWPVVSAEQRSPFGPAPLQSLRPYYEPLRP